MKQGLHEVNAYLFPIALQLINLHFVYGLVVLAFSTFALLHTVCQDFETTKLFVTACAYLARDDITRNNVAENVLLHGYVKIL